VFRDCSFNCATDANGVLEPAASSNMMPDTTHTHAPARARRSRISPSSLDASSEFNTMVGAPSDATSRTGAKDSATTLPISPGLRAS